MAFDYRQASNRVKEKALLVAQRYHKAVAQRDEARRELAELERQLADRDNEIRLLKTRLENLTVVTTALPSRQAVAESRKYLTELVREIDQCIKDLTS